VDSFVDRGSLSTSKDKGETMAGGTTVVGYLDRNPRLAARVIRAQKILEQDGKSYVVLRRGSDIIDVYRIRKSGALMRLMRWPAALTVSGT